MSMEKTSRSRIEALCATSESHHMPTDARRLKSLDRADRYRLEGFGSSRLKIRQIEYFVAVVELGSLSAAAAEKDITVQGLSQAIADFEEELGVQLLVRDRTGTIPTAFGFECYARAKSLLRHFGEFDVFAHSQRRSSDR